MTVENFVTGIKVIGSISCLIILFCLFYILGSLRKDFIGQISENSERIEKLEKRVSKIEE